jgi:polyhydroxyalkanoate synthase
MNTPHVPVALTKAYADWALRLVGAPARQWELARQAMELPTRIATRLMRQGTEDSRPTTAAQDHRFDGPGWEQWPYNVLKDGFQASEAWWDQAAQVEGMSAHHQEMVRFYTRQMLDAVSPSNWLGSNPEVLKAGWASAGQSWVKGYLLLLQDLAQQQRAKLPTATRVLAPLPYAVGVDVAVTPGKVVFRNRLIELIQYTPTTDKVAQEPLLIVPSCIMKYYILDLSPGNSMVRYLVDQGYTVFMVSWKNPQIEDRDLGLDDYLQDGVLAAMAAVRAASGANRIHAMGYCLGGTFLSIAAAALGRGEGPGAKNEKLPSLASVTLLAALTDFTAPGEMGVFIDEDQVKTLQDQMAETGYLSGQQMAGTFQFLNSRDLIWSRNTRRYLLGQDEVGNDMMSWNADVTRLPARMHSEYLEQLFLKNALAQGQFRCGDAGVALTDIGAPMLVVGTVRDHVCPWQSVFKTPSLTETETTFILAAGGHNAGIVSEPGHPNRSYQMARMEQVQGGIKPAEWLAAAPKHEGSWWAAMHQWLQSHTTKQVAARATPAASSLCDAPGEYVMARYAD